MKIVEVVKGIFNRKSIPSGPTEAEQVKARLAKLMEIQERMNVQPGDLHEKKLPPKEAVAPNQAQVAENPTTRKIAELQQDAQAIKNFMTGPDSTGSSRIEDARRLGEIEAQISKLKAQSSNPTTSGAASNAESIQVTKETVGSGRNKS